MQMEHCERLIENLIDGMGESLFTDLVDFDVDLRESTNYDIKILMARRFLTLHTGLDAVIQYQYGNDVMPYGEFVTNLSIALKDIKNKKILIVDDTFLHGRAVKKIYDELIECGCKRENITIKIFLKNEEAKIVDDSLLERLICKRTGDTNTWRYVSSKIVDSFIASGQPYISYLPYYEADFESEQAKMISKFIEKEKLQNIATSTQKSYDVSSYLYSKETAYNICRSNLIRLYKYEKAKKWILIPYAYLKPLTFEQVANIYSKMTQLQIQIKYSGSAEFLQKSNELSKSRIKSQYAYSLLTYLTSVIWGSSFLDNQGMIKWKRNMSVEKSSLGCEINIPKEVLGTIIKAFDGIDVLGNEFKLQQNDDIQAIAQPIAEANEQRGVSTDAINFLDNYLKMSSEQDEKLAEQRKERMRGIEIERIYMFIQNREKVWGKLQEVIDAGRGTIAVGSNFINGIEYLDSFLYAGEQNHACNEDNLVCFVYPLLQYEMYCHKKGISIEEEKKVKAILINEIRKQNGELSKLVSCQETDFLLQKSLYKKYREYYWNKYPIFKNDTRVINAMRIEKEYE